MDDPRAAISTDDITSIPFDTEEEAVDYILTNLSGGAELFIKVDTTWYTLGWVGPVPKNPPSF